MSSASDEPGHPFDCLQPHAPDVLLSLIGLFRADSRPDKIDLGVGVYRDSAGRTPVMEAVKAAETRLLTQQTSKAYLGPEGDLGFLEALTPIVLGPHTEGSVFAVQTPGGTGALRLAAELIGVARSGARILMGVPTWPNHPQIFDRVGLKTVTYRHFDAAVQRLCFDDLLGALDRARGGDAVLLHGCCHNPTGADFSVAQWQAIAEIIGRRGLLPLIDLAYQGFGEGLENDTAGLRCVLAAAPDVLIAYSCDKNFGLYRDRVGALFVVSRDRKRRDLAAANIKALARANWSMPPDHGAAVARIVLEDAELTESWRAELEGMRQRLTDTRSEVAAAVPALTALTRQKGMFAQLPLTPAQVAAIRSRHGVYMAESGRINLAGLTPALVPQFAEAYAVCSEEVPA